MKTKREVKDAIERIEARCSAWGDSTSRPCGETWLEALEWVLTDTPWSEGEWNKREGGDEGGDVE